MPVTAPAHPLTTTSSPVTGSVAIACSERGPGPPVTSTRDQASPSTRQSPFVRMPLSPGGTSPPNIHAPPEGSRDIVADVRGLGPPATSTSWNPPGAASRIHTSPTLTIGRSAGSETATT